jgi:hypothetical protein
MVPPDTKEHLRGQISARNPAAAFVQGYAGIPDSSQSRPRPPSAAAQPDPPQSPTTPSPGRSASPSTDHRTSPSPPGGPPRSSPRNRKAPLWDCGPGNCRWPPPGNTPSPTLPSRLASPSPPTSAPTSAPRPGGPGSGVVSASLPRARRGPAG